MLFHGPCHRGQEALGANKSKCLPHTVVGALLMPIHGPCGLGEPYEAQPYSQCMG